MLKTSFTWTLSILLVSACGKASSGVNPELPPVPVSRPDSTASGLPRENPTSSASRVWDITPNNSSNNYTSSVKTHIQQLTASGAEVEDSSFVQTRYAIKLDRRADTTVIEGSVTALLVQSGQRIGFSSPALLFPISFRGQFFNHELRFDGLTSKGQILSSSVACESPSQMAISSVQRTFFLMPLQIKTGDTWQDSTSSTVCSGSLPITLIDKRTYKLLGETEFQGVKVLVLTRNERALFYGEGSQDQHRITIRGETLGTAQLYADPITGFLFNVTADSKTTLSIETSGRVQQFLQSSREVTARAN